MLLLIAEILVIICGVLLSIWFRRPRSRFQNQRVQYRTLDDLLSTSFQEVKFKTERQFGKKHDEAPKEVSVDFVVVGGGPGGLAAARTLLQSRSSSTVALIESGRDPMSSSLFKRIFYFHSPASFSLFHTEYVEVPHIRKQHNARGGCTDKNAVTTDTEKEKKSPSLPSEKDRQHWWSDTFPLPWSKGADWSYICTRPLRLGASLRTSTTASMDQSRSSEEQPLSSTASHHSVSSSSPSTLEDSTAFPQGRRLGGTAAHSWGLAVPSMFRKNGESNQQGSKRDSAGKVLLQNGGGCVLPTRLPSDSTSHPISSAFSSVLAHTKGIHAAPESSTVDDVLQRRTARHKVEKRSEDAHGGSQPSTEALRMVAQEKADGVRFSVRSPEWRPSATSSRDAVVWNPPLYLNEDHRPLLLGNAILEPCGSALRRLFVLDSCTVTDLEYETETSVGAFASTVQERSGNDAFSPRSRVTAVKVVRSPSSSCSFGSFLPRFFQRKKTVPQHFRIRVRQGVVLAAGLVGTPLLLSCFPPVSSLPSPSPPLSSSVLSTSSPSSHTPLASSKELLPESVRWSIPQEKQEKEGKKKESVWWCRDAVGLPLIYKANPGVTQDEIIQQAQRSPLLFTCRSLFLETPRHALTSFTDLICSIPLPETEYGPRAELLLFVMPFGGRSDKLFYPLGIDKILGSYRHHAVLFYLVLTGMQGLHHGFTFPPLTARGASPCASALPLSSTSEQRQEAGCGVGSSATSSTVTSSTSFSTSASSLSNSLPHETVLQLKSAFSYGIRLVRECTKQKPLCFLLQGEGEQEAIDYTLLHEDLKKAKRFAQLMFTPLVKMTLTMKKELVQLAQWGHEVAAKNEYLENYITQHTQWMGFGSGTSEAFLEVPPHRQFSSHSPPMASLPSPSSLSFFDLHSFFVKDVTNMVVGDCSGVTKALWEDETLAGTNALLAGNIATAMDMGTLASRQLAASFSVPPTDHGDF